MPKSLDVYLQSNLVGHLSQDSGGQMHFQYVESWLNGSGAAPLSQSLPLRKERFSQKECRGYFGGILPEASNREVVARNLGISARNDFAMLKEIGGECAGAVTFVPTRDRLPENRNSHRTLSSSELAAVLRELRKRPLLAGQEGIRQSLAGAQDKVAVCLIGDEISLPLDGAPSTHVLKPAVERFEGVVQNESLCMRLAAAIGLPTAKVEARSVEGMDYLRVERYDRVYRKDLIHGPVLERLHQEDFCQAFGIVSEMKYQNEGGPSLKQCFALLRKVSSAPVIDLARLLDAVIFNYIVGNNDAHGKNFSLLYRGLGTACMQEESAMTVIPMVTRRLLRTKQAAAYLSMSEWKLRRLIQTEIIPFVQDQRGGPFLSPAYDFLTTSVYAGYQQNPPGISFLGKKTWTPGKNLSRFIASTFGIPLREQSVMLERISDAVADTVPLVRERMSELPEFRDIGKRMLLAWQEGITSLRDRRAYAVGDWPANKVFEGISDPPKLEDPKTVLGRSPLLGSRSSRSKKLSLCNAVDIRYWVDCEVFAWVR